MSITAKLAEVLRLIAEMDAAELLANDAISAWHQNPDLEDKADAAQVAERNAADAAADAAVNLVRDPELAGLVRDAERLDFLERAGDVFISIVVDAPHDGEYSFGHDLGPTTYAPTLRDAIDAALSGRDGQGVGK